MEAILLIGRFIPQHGHLEAIAELQDGDGLVVDESGVLWIFAADILIKHDLAIDDLIQREVVLDYGEYHGKAVFAERAGCNVFQ
jgi:hypothetical protein